MTDPLPAKLMIHDAAYALDGGTTMLMATDARGAERSVTLMQQASVWRDAPATAIPGRLYLDDELVVVRSEVEAAVLGLLRRAEIVSADGDAAAEGDRLPPDALIIGQDIKRVLGGSPDENLRAMVAQVVEFVSSDKYVRFAAEVDAVRGEKK